MAQKGNASESGGQDGDVLIRVNVKPDSYFQRKDYDIYTTAYLTISEAVLGHKVEVKTLYGNQSVPVKPGT